MLYANIELKKQKKEMEWGELFQYEAGESGRGRKLLCLPAYPDFEDIEEGLHKNLTIGYTKAGRPRINKADDKKMYMLLSAQGRYTRRGNGTIWCLKEKEAEIKVIARGNGADGTAGRIGFWDVLLLEVPEEEIIRVRTSGAGYGTPSDFYVVHEGEVYKCTIENLECLCEKIEIEVPCGIEIVDGETKFIADEWTML